MVFPTGNYEVVLLSDLTAVEQDQTLYDFAVITTCEDDSGLPVGELLLRQNPECRILFITCRPDQVSRVYRIDHVAQIPLSCLEKDISQCLRQTLWEGDDRATISITTRSHVWMVPIYKIRTIERRERHSYILMDDGETLMTREKLDDLFAKLPPDRFFRSHVSYIVNLDNVARMTRKQITMDNGANIPISRVHENEALTLRTNLTLKNRAGF